MDIKAYYRVFPSGPVAKTLSFQSRVSQVQSLVRELVPHAATEFACTTKDLTCHTKIREPTCAAKTQCSQTDKDNY